MKVKLLLSLSLVICISLSHAQMFAGTGTGAIPDGPGTPTCGNDGAPLDITFEVANVIAPLTSVEVDIDMTHTWVTDITAELIAPDSTSHILISRTLATTATACGDSSGLGGVYTFTDDAAGSNWWDAAFAVGGADIVPIGEYKATEAGGDLQTNPAPTTDITAAFSAIASANGTWTLRITDGGAGDTGTINAANLFLIGGVNPDVIYANGFEVLVPIQ